ncbi:MAG: hypothetical protein HYX33_01270 [Actinobacteria bacterium]|nr:hypothetical protein [Actinomycetota bacterium]
MKPDLQGKLFDQTKRAAGPDTDGAMVANGAIEATVTLSVRQLEALVEPLVQRAVERALAERMPSAAGVASHVPVAVAARLLGMAPKTVANMLADGRLTRSGAPRRPLVALDEIEAITHRRVRERPPLAPVPPRPTQVRPRAAGTFSSRARAGWCGSTSSERLSRC